MQGSGVLQQLQILYSFTQTIFAYLTMGFCSHRIIQHLKNQAGLSSNTRRMQRLLSRGLVVQVRHSFEEIKGPFTSRFLLHPVGNIVCTRDGRVGHEKVGRRLPYPLFVCAPFQLSRLVVLLSTFSSPHLQQNETDLEAHIACAECLLCYQISTLIANKSIKSRRPYYRPQSKNTLDSTRSNKTATSGTESSA